MPSPPRPVVRVSVPAKINLWLSVGPVRADGFHELHTVFHAVDLWDEVVVAASATRSLTVTGITDGVPLDETNVAWRAVSLLAAAAGVEPAVRLRIHKRIPVAGGLAGGSADAAGALLACNALWGSPVPTARLHELAAELGSDVAFPLMGGTAVGTGRGEVLAPVDGPPLHWVLVPAAYGVSAGAAYRELDRLRADGAAPAPIGPPVAGVLGNDLQAAALSLRPELAQTLSAGPAAGATAGLVSGSGPTCAFLFPSRTAAESGALALGRHAIVASGPVTPKVCVP